MRVRFNGVIETKKSGCKSCGRGGRTENRMVYTKRYILPSGQMQMFRAGIETEVSEKDGEFLLSYACFEKVEE